jgi:ethanolamine permease
MPAEEQSYDSVSADYFARRGLRRYAGVASLWALGVGGGGVLDGEAPAVSF